MVRNAKEETKIC